MKSLSVELKIAVLIIFTAAIVGAAGYVAYQSLSKILVTIKKEAQPNLTLVLLKEVNSSLLQAENSIRYYTLTGENRFLRPYYQVIKSTDKKIALLRKYNLDSSSRKSAIDSIELLVHQKFDVWEVLLETHTANRVNTALSQLSHTIDSSVDTVTIRIPKTTPAASVDSVIKPIIQPIEIQEEPGFFSRLFKKKPKSSTEIAAEVNYQMEAIVEFEPELVDSALQVGVNPITLQDEILRIKEEEDLTYRMLTAREVSLSRRNDALSQKINILIIKLEKEEIRKINRKATEADVLVQSTHQLLTLFLIAFSVLLIGVFWVIQNYIRKSHTYQHALIKAKDEAIRLSEAKARFMANVTHEIRTPMHAIAGFTEQLLEQLEQGKSKEQVETIKNSADHLLAIINDVLDFSRFESENFEIENINFEPRNVINEVHKLYKMKAVSQNLRFDIHVSDDLPEVLIGDPLRLKQIMLNLVSNAIKFTSEGFVKLSVDWISIEPNQILLIFQVADSGIGISSENLEHIFDEFSQAESGTTRKYGGTGLGLTIVKKLVELLNGTIHVSSALSSGTAFTVEIPLKTGCKKGDETSAGKSIAINPLLLKDKKILVADDDEYNRKLIAHILDKWKLEYGVVEDGVQLIKHYEHEVFDLILLDVRMPGIDGIEAASRIRNLSNKQKRNIPLIALTATVSREEVSRCLMAGINKVVSKPYSEVELFTSMCQVFEIELRTIQTEEKVSESECEPQDEYPELFRNLYHIANNDEKFVAEMLEMFIQTSRKGLSAIRSAMKERDWMMVAEQAHKIKSPCKHLGAQQTAELLKSIETLSRNGGNPTLIVEKVKEAEKQLNTLIKKIEVFLVKKREPEKIKL